MKKAVTKKTEVRGHKSKGPVLKNLSSDDLLGSTLAELEAIITEAQKQARDGDTHSRIVKGKRQHGSGGVFSAMAEPHLHALQELVVAHGVQLMPSLDAIVRLVLLGVSSLAVTSNTFWELAALLGVQFKAGAVRILDELMELLLKEKSPFLLAAPCVVGSVATAGESAGDTEENAAAEDVSNVARNLRAFEDLLFSVGPFLSTSTIQRAALRFAQEVVLGGILDVPTLQAVADSGFHQQQQASSPVKFSVAVELQPICVELLTAFLLLCRPLPGIVSASAVRVIKELPARMMGPRGHSHRQHLLRGVAQLSVTLTALRHPYALPFYLPPKDIVEKVVRRVEEEDSNAVGAEAAQMPPALEANVVVETRNDASSSFLPSAPQSFQQPIARGAMMQDTSAAPKGDERYGASATLRWQCNHHQEGKQQQQQQQKKQESIPVEKQVSVSCSRNNSNNEDEDNYDDMPEIDMED